MTDKTQEELDFLLLRFGNSCISQIPRDINYTKGLILDYINKNYEVKTPKLNSYLDFTKLPDDKKKAYISKWIEKANQMQRDEVKTKNPNEIINEGMERLYGTKKDILLEERIEQPLKELGKDKL